MFSYTTPQFQWGARNPDHEVGVWVDSPRDLSHWKSQQFKSFWDALSKCGYEFPVELQPYFLIALKTAGYDEVNVYVTELRESINPFEFETYVQPLLKNLINAGPTESRFSFFWNFLSQAITPYDIPFKFKQTILTALQTAGYEKL